MNLGSILGLGCLCQPFPAGFTILGGGRQPRSIGLSTWTNPDILGTKCQKAAKGRTNKLHIRVLGDPKNRFMKGSMLGAAFGR